MGSSSFILDLSVAAGLDLWFASASRDWCAPGYRLLNPKLTTPRRHTPTSALPLLSSSPSLVRPSPACRPLPMRRAAVQAFRSARRPCLRKFARSRLALTPSSHSHGLGYRSLSTRRSSITVLTSSMQVRVFQGALVAAAVAAGAFYASRGTQSFGTSTSSVADQSRSLSSSTGSAETAEVTRRALVVDHEQLFTGTITGDGPVSKETDDQGRKVLEMLTPEQATHKLRKNEESWIVGRGQGVVRYDVVQSRFFPSSSCPPFRMF